jgi:hypothetical protein
MQKEAPRKGEACFLVMPSSTEGASVRIRWFWAGGSYSLSSTVPYIGCAACRDQQDRRDQGD